MPSLASESGITLLVITEQAVSTSLLNVQAVQALLTNVDQQKRDAALSRAKSVSLAELNEMLQNTLQITSLSSANLEINKESNRLIGRIVEGVEHISSLLNDLDPGPAGEFRQLPDRNTRVTAALLNLVRAVGTSATSNSPERSASPDRSARRLDRLEGILMPGAHSSDGKK